MKPTHPHRRHAALGVAVSVAAVVCATAVSAPAQLPQSQPVAKSVRAPGCTLRGATTIKANRDARIFQVTRRGFGNVYGCRRSAGRAFVLGVVVGECQNSDEIRLTEVAGRRAALGIHECSLTSGWWTVRLVNLGNGRREFDSAPLGVPVPDEATVDALGRIVVASDGAVGWTATRSVRGVTLAVEVRRRMRGSASRSIVLDSGTEIDPGSLRKRGRTLSWTKAGVRRSATF